MNPEKERVITDETITWEKIGYEVARTLIVILLLELFSIPAHVTNIARFLDYSPGTITTRTQKMRKSKLVFHYEKKRQAIHEVIEKGAASLIWWFENSEQGKRRGGPMVAAYENTLQQMIKKGELTVEKDPLEDFGRKKDEELASFLDNPVKYLRKRFKIEKKEPEIGSEADAAKSSE